MSRIPWPWLVILGSAAAVVGWILLGWLAVWLESLAR